MSFEHLTRVGNSELARMLIGAAKTIFAASVVALFFPPAGAERSIGWFLAGVVVAGALGGIGILILERSNSEGPSKARTNRRGK